MQNIDQATLDQLMALYRANPSLLTRVGEGDAGPTYSQAQGSTVNGYTIQIDPSSGRPLVTKPIKESSWGTEASAVFDPLTNQYLGVSSGDSTNLGLAKFVAGALSMYGAGTGLDSMMNGAAAGAGTGGAAAASGMTPAQQAAMMAANGMTDAEIAAALGTQGAQSAGLAGIGGGATTAGAGMAPTAGASASSGSAYDSALKAGSTGGSLFGDAAKSIGGNGQLLGAGLGAVAGALDGKDKTQSSTRDPWAEAQPFLKQLLAQGSQLATQYQNQPFSQAQKTAYGNVGGLLDLTNANAQGLMSAFNQIGNNKFVRGQRNTGGATTGLLSGFAPGSYGSFGI